VIADGGDGVVAHAPRMTLVTPLPLAAIAVSAAMHEGVVSCGREAPLSEVARLMSEQQIHCIVVVGENARSPWGLISDLDLTAAASVRGLDGQTAGATAATPVVLVLPGETLERAAQLMTEHRVAHLVVVDPYALRPLGVLSTLDIARAATAAA
jgi:CBS domain-containing protein